MKVFQVKKTHPAAVIEQNMARPTQKQDIPAVPMDSRMQGATLAAEVMATLQTQAKTWHTFCWTIVDMPVDGRVAFGNAIDKELSAMKAENEKVHGASKGLNSKLNSATVQVSRLRTIAKAFNAGASITGFHQFMGWVETATTYIEPGAERSVGWVNVYDYAKAFLKGQAGGDDESAQSVKVKLQNFLKKLKKGEAKFTTTDAINYTKAFEMVEAMKD